MFFHLLVGLRLLLLAGQGVPGLTDAAGESGARAWLLLHPGNQAPGSRGAAQQRGLRRAHTWLRGRAGKAPPPCQSHRGVLGKCGVLGMGGSTLLGSGTRGKSKLEADWSPPGEDGSLLTAQSPAK